MNQDYVSFHNHTKFSILDSLIGINDLFAKVKSLNQSAVAITDHATLAGAHDALLASKSSGVKLIMGCEFYFVDDLADSTTNQKLKHIILCAKNYNGYKNLLKLLKEANDNSFLLFKKVVPRIDWNILQKYSSDLICTTACSNGIIGNLLNNKKISEADLVTKKLKEIFEDNLGLEIQPNNLKRQANQYNNYTDQSFVNHQLIQLSKKYNIKIIPATNAHYLNKEDHEAHDCLLAINSLQPIDSNSRLRYPDSEFYVKSREEIVLFFSRLYGRDTAESWCDNTLEFAEKCEFPEWIDPGYSNPSKKELPEFDIKSEKLYPEFKEYQEKYPNSQNIKEDTLYLRFLCQKNFNKIKSEDKEQYLKQLNEEIDVLDYCGVSSYMLIVMDYLRWARDNNIRVGPGRGSVGGSLVAYLLDIHQADPLKYGLIFSRFHNKLKQSYSDIDADFSQRGKPLVEKYLTKKYGSDKVAGISNYLTMTAKPYVKAISRAFKYGGDSKSAVTVGNNLSSYIPKDIHGISDALEKLPILAEYANNPNYQHIKKFAPTIGGTIVAMATHAAGTVIGKRSLEEIVPLRRDKDGNIILEYEKERAEANGLVKMDILGLSTLDIIELTEQLIVKNNKKIPQIDIESYDEKTYDLISRGDTVCVFQFGTSAGTIDLCKKIKPKCIEDLANITALARPGCSKEVRAGYIDILNGKKEVEYLHPKLKRAFEKTLGYALFEESLLILVQDLAGWDLHQADSLRKMVKDKGKNPEKANKIKNKFLEDCLKNDVSEEDAIKVWENVIEEFQKYAFNKSHAVLYSFISYVTAYYKAHFPVEFLTANLIMESKSGLKVEDTNIPKIKQELKKLGVTILPPDLNKSEMTYSILDEKTILTGFESLKFMSEQAIPEIINNRPYNGFKDFIFKTKDSKINIPSIQALIASGCFDFESLNRKTMFLYVADFRKKSQLYFSRNNELDNFNYPFPQDLDDWSISEKNALETKYLGEGLTGSFKDIYPNFFSYNSNIVSNILKTITPDYIEEKKKNKEYISLTIEGVVESFFIFKIKKQDSKLLGRDMAKLSLIDVNNNIIKITIFPDDLENFLKQFKSLTGKPEIVINCALVISGKLDTYEGEVGLILDDIKRASLPPKLPAKLKHQKVTLKIPGKRKTKAQDLDSLIEQHEEELIENGILDNYPEVFEDLLDAESNNFDIENLI